LIPLKDSTVTPTFPRVTLTLIAINLIIFTIEFAVELLNPDLFNTILAYGGSIPAEFLHINYWPHAIMALFTSMFLHGSWMHVIGNMWFLWLFGDNVEDRMGHRKFLLFYLLCGIVADLVNFMVDPNSLVPSVGASGAIAGVMGAYLLLFKRAYIITYIPPFFLVPIPSVVYLVFWFIYQFISGAGALVGDSSTSIAFWAHIGGFAFGALCHRAFLLKEHRYGENSGFIDI